MTRHVTVLLSLLASGALLAQSQQQIRDQILGETDAVKQQADDLNAKVLAPGSYAQGMEVYRSAVDALEKGKDLGRVREDLAEAKGFFQTAVQASRLARTTFTDALAARGAAEKAEAAKYAARDWQRADQALISAAGTLEAGNLDNAIKESGNALARYRETEAKAVAAKARAAQ